LGRSIGGLFFLVKAYDGIKKQGQAMGLGKRGGGASLKCNGLIGYHQSGASSIFCLTSYRQKILKTASCPVEKGGERARANSDKGKEHKFIKLWRTKK
jgi:hypothetical protein